MIMHNGQTCDPMNKFARAIKEISGKRKKTDEDYAEMGRLEWIAGLYVNEEGKLIIPADVLDSALIRPGRVDLIEHFTPSGPDEIARLIAYWYDVPVTVGLMEQIPSDLEMTPADVAELCKQHETAEQTIAALRSSSLVLHH